MYRQNTHKMAEYVGPSPVARNEVNFLRLATAYELLIFKIILRYQLKFKNA